MQALIAEGSAVSLSIWDTAESFATKDMKQDIRRDSNETKLVSLLSRRMIYVNTYKLILTLIFIGVMLIIFVAK